MMVYFFCAPEASEKFKKVFEEHRLARRLVSECSSGGKNALVTFVYEFCYFNDEKLTKISKYIGTYPNMPNFIIS